MAFTCLPADKAQSFKDALKSHDIQIGDLLKMTTEERNKVFESFAGSDAKAMNTLFEEKLVLKNKVQGLKNFINKTTASGRYSPEKIAELKQAASDYRAAQQERIFTPQEHQTFLGDLAAKKAGTKVSLEEANKIGALAKKMNEELAKPTDNPSGVSDAYLKAAGDYKTYVSSLQPVSGLQLIFRNLTTTMRNFMLMNPSTPIKTLTGQIENSVLDHFTRRLSTLTLKTDNAGLAGSMKREAWQTYKDTGLNTASMGSLDDTGKLGEGHRFDVPKGALSGGSIMRTAEAVTRKAAAVTSKVAIDWEHNIAFTKFHQSAFFDAANVLSSKVAATPEEAATILKDAARIEPTTTKGAAVRDGAQYQAGRATGVSDTFLSGASMNLVKYFDSHVPGLGSFLFQIVKIPTNIISYGIENAGGGLVKGPFDMLQGRKMMASEDPATQYKGAAVFARGTQTLIRTVGVMTASAMITSSMSKSDFKKDMYGDTFVKIDNTWVNTEYFYLIAPAMAGFMDARATKDQSLIGQAGAYAAGTMGGLKRLPVINEAQTLITEMTNPDNSKGVGKYLNNLISQRLQPSFLRLLDDGQGVKGLFFSTTGLPTDQELKKLNAK